MKYVIIFFFFAVLGYAQDITKLQDYLPPSPEAQEFIKYGEYPVGMYTGVPNISIPLYTIDVRDMQVPISLSYHASGIQVDQIASWVGLGWSLNAGGMISKIPRGIPDDLGFGFLTSSLPEYNNLVFDFNFYEDVATGFQDTESDIYHYNFSGYSGKFFFDRDKEIRLIDEAPIDITYSAGKFTIITKEGITYEFNEIERTQSVNYSLGNSLGTGTEQDYISSWHLSKITSSNKIDTITFNYDIGTSFKNNQYNYSESTGNSFDSSCPPQVISNVHDGGGSEISSQVETTQNPKRLKEIIFSNGKVVFSRLSDRQDISRDRLTKVDVYKGQTGAYSLLKSYGFLHDYTYSNQTSVFPPVSNNARRYRLRLLELHEFDTNTANAKKHIFEYNSTMLPPAETNGKDFWGYYNGQNTNVNLIPEQPFQYLGNTVGGANREPNSNFMQAGMLTKITYPTQGFTEFFYEPHQYETTETNLTTKTKSVFAVGQQGVIGDGIYLEDTEVFTPNYSGYATITIEASDRNSTTGVYPRVTLQRAGSSNYLIDHSTNPSTYSYPMNPPQVNITLPPVWLDKDVSYTLKAVADGTSNSNEFDGAAYMRVEIDYEEEVIGQTPVTKIAGGLRIQRIDSYSKPGEMAFSKLYEYNDETLITPEAFIEEQYLDSEIVQFSFCDSGGNGNNTCVSNSTIRRFYYGGTVRGLTLSGGSPVVYSDVDEVSTDGSNNRLGKTNYTFAIQTDEILPVPTSYSGGIMQLKKDWMGGQNVSKRTYKEGDTEFITQEVNGHTLKRYDESYKMYKIVHSKRTSGNCFYADDQSRFLTFEYPIFTGAKLLSSTQTTTKYENGENLTTSTSIFYDNETHLQPTRTVTTGSDRKVKIVEYIYPDDVTDVSSLGFSDITVEEKDAILRLQDDDLHQVTKPIQSTIRVEDEQNVLLSITNTRTLYQDFGNNLVLPKVVKSQKGKSTTNLSPLEDRIVFSDYDSSGNPIEVSQADGPKMSYIWGYDGQHPVAKIENADYYKIRTALGLATVEQVKALNESNMDIINGLRGSLSDCMITTYTYDPLVGVTSITDPRGYTTYFEYDDFNRLKFVKDADQKLLTENQYHYKNQQ